MMLNELRAFFMEPNTMGFLGTRVKVLAVALGIHK